jgi:hypothetical protein
VVLNTLIHAVRHEFSYREFATVVDAHYAQLTVALRLCNGLRTPDGVRILSHAAKDLNPDVARGHR